MGLTTAWELNLCLFIEEITITPGINLFFFQKKSHNVAENIKLLLKKYDFITIF